MLTLILNHVLPLRVFVGHTPAMDAGHTPAMEYDLRPYLIIFLVDMRKT